MKALEQQQYDAAATAFRKAIEADPKDYGAHFHLALALSLLNKDSEAIPEYKKVLELKPGLYEAELNLGMLLLRQKDAPGALPYLESATNKKPKEVRPAFYYAEALLALGQHAKAEGAYQKVIELDPKNAGAEYGLGRAIVAQNRLPDAAPHFRKAAEIDPGFHDVLLELASHYEHNKQTAEAIEIYKKFPDNPGARERLGELLLESGQASAAVEPLEQAYKQSPTAANRYALAMAYVNNKALEKAEPLLAEAVASEPSNIELRMTYGRVLRDQRKFPGAAQEFYKVAQVKADYVEAWTELATMLVSLQQDGQALAALDKVRSLNAEKAGHFYLRAILLDRNKQQQPAVEAYEKFLQMSEGKNPDEEFKARQRVRILKKDLSKR
jgi:tetratricopeptide (TPR) repeat protein